MKGGARREIKRVEKQFWRETEKQFCRGIEAGLVLRVKGDRVHNRH